ncbi:hypothetical protein NLI96_g12014 [Meripilus lineatus]|uniref:Cytochrome P450 n=1 Tax=Meripilus lineatus TaxID=2056292 RepID=A0AAD5UUT5_9APHY|nr:hypothetical protein NLI96_g12014 [Physisporinus lineatus]
MLTPVFSIKHMRFMTPIFYQITHTLRDVIRERVKDSPQEVDILHWMGRTALELIGQGGLGYSFDPLVEDISDTFGDAIKGLVPAFGGIIFFRNILEFMVKIGPPEFRAWLIDRSPSKNLKEIKRISDTLYAQSKAIIDGKKAALESGDEALLQQVGEGKDIMSILLRANMLASEEDKLPEDELLGQMSTLVFAAMDTTSNALSRVLHLLAQHQSIQDKLRAELTAIDSSEDIPYDQLVELPYLDAICRETLRLYPPVGSLTRQAQKDIVMPLTWPIRGVDGKMIHEIFVPKGTNVFTSISASNQNKAIWGEDALKWKPERWLSPLPEAVSAAHIPGVYSNLMTFNGGGRSCIGFKFSQLEMKVVLADLVKSFRFSEPKAEIVWNCGGIVYPTVGHESNVPSMPILVELVSEPTRPN